MQDESDTLNERRNGYLQARSSLGLMVKTLVSVSALLGTQYKYRKSDHVFSNREAWFFDVIVKESRDRAKSNLHRDIASGLSTSSCGASLRDFSFFLKVWCVVPHAE